jgi:hypothetical protein
MEKGEVDDSYNKRGDNVASPRSSSRVGKEKTNKKGEQRQQEFTEFIKKMLGSLDAQLEIEPNVNTINNIINKKDKKKLN